MTYLHNATPSLRPSRRSPGGNFSPSVSSIHARTWFAAEDVYLDSRKLRISESKEDTDAIVNMRACGSSYSGVGSMDSGVDPAQDSLFVFVDPNRVVNVRLFVRA